MVKTNLKPRIQRHKRIRAKIFGTSERPRISVFRSNHHIYAQIIDDEKGRTLVSASSLDKGLKTKSGNKTKLAQKVAELLVERAKKVGIKTAVFDRGGFRFQGRIKALAEALRKDLSF